jgi:hypothetical protein
MVARRQLSEALPMLLLIGVGVACFVIGLALGALGIAAWACSSVLNAL